MYLTLPYHGNWGRTFNFRRHWLLHLVIERGDVIGTTYEAVDDDDGIWTLRIEKDSDITASALYENRVPLGDIKDNNLDEFEKIVKETPLPVGDEDCQNWVRKVVERSVAAKVAPSRALPFLAMVPSN